MRNQRPPGGAEGGARRCEGFQGTKLWGSCWDQSVPAVFRVVASTSSSPLWQMPVPKPPTDHLQGNQLPTKDIKDREACQRNNAHFCNSGPLPRAVAVACAGVIQGHFSAAVSRTYEPWYKSPLRGMNKHLEHVVHGEEQTHSIRW